MTSEHSNGNAGGRAFAVGGAIVFVCSLIYGMWSYAVTFGVAASQQSVADPAFSNILLFSAFALHHSLFARSGLRGWVGRLVSSGLERSVYVWVASVLFATVVAAWQTVPGAIWRLTGPAAGVLSAVQIAGILVTLRASAALDVFSLAGLRQAFGNVAPGSAHLVETGLYGLVRHPVYFGWVLMVWPSPAMTGTRFVFAAVSTLYLALAIPFEERSLRGQFGAAYTDYAAKVRWRMLPGIY